MKLRTFATHKTITIPAKKRRYVGVHWVTMSDALTKAGQAMTLVEKRLIALAMSKLAREGSPEKGTPVTRITADEFAREYGLALNTVYDELKRACERLYTRSVTIYDPDHVLRNQDENATRKTMHWVSKVHYQAGEAWVELYWWPEIVPHLIGIKDEFIRYPLQSVSALKSVYSWRLLELLTRCKRKGEADYSIEDFATAMDATDKQRQNFAHIRRKIIEPAVKELTEKEGWHITWEVIKSGRRVARLRFHFQEH